MVWTIGRRESAGRSKKGHRWWFALLLAWILFVLYPNPGKLVTSLYRLHRPPVDAALVSELARGLEGLTPREIQAFVYEQLPYRYDWAAYNIPWYFPTLDEALLKGVGDCKARYVLFASLLDALEIPYRKNISLTHIWVEYDGKLENRSENGRETLIAVDETGRTRVRLPRADLQRSWASFRHAFWEIMPIGRKMLLFTGFPVVYGLSGLVALLGRGGSFSAKWRSILRRVLFGRVRTEPPTFV